MEESRKEDIYNRAKHVIDSHWGHYNEKLFQLVAKATDPDKLDDEMIALLEFIFKESGRHFYKHAIEDVEAGKIKVDIHE